MAHAPAVMSAVSPETPMIRRGLESDKSEAAVLASSEKRTALPLVPVPLEYVNESPQEAVIAQLVSDNIERDTNRPQRRPAMVTGHDLANAEHRGQETALTANAPHAVKFAHVRISQRRERTHV
jgi:hypothetical protein